MKMSIHKVWVTWKDPNDDGNDDDDEGEDLLTAQVVVEDNSGRDHHGANTPSTIDDLRNAFVQQQQVQGLQIINHADVQVRERESGEILDKEERLENYFVCSSRGRESNQGPGQSAKTALFLTLPKTSMEPVQEQEQQQQHLDMETVLRRLLPFIDALPAVIREVSLMRKHRLNPWENEKSFARTTTTASTSPPEKFRHAVISYYQRASNSQKSAKCQILDNFTPIQEAHDTIAAVHIWKASTRGKYLDEFGLEEQDVNNPRNGLFLTKGIEDAFDHQQICFLYNILQSKLVLWVADSNIMGQTIEGSTTRTFSDVHQKPLLCPPDRLPYRRLLSWHARLTLERWTESIPIDNFTSKYDNAPGSTINRGDRIASAINRMVEPGDDASVEKDE